jgi:hypothetical protein
MYIINSLAATRATRHNLSESWLYAKLKDETSWYLTNINCARRKAKQRRATAAFPSASCESQTFPFNNHNHLLSIYPEIELSIESNRTCPESPVLISSLTRTPTPSVLISTQPDWLASWLGWPAWQQRQTRARRDHPRLVRARTGVPVPSATIHGVLKVRLVHTTWPSSQQLFRSPLHRYIYTYIHTYIHPTQPRTQLNSTPTTLKAQLTHSPSIQVPKS